MRIRLLVTGLVLLAPGAPRAVVARGQVPGQEDNGQVPAMAMDGRMVRGTVSAVTPEKIVLKTESGDTYTVALSANTRVMRQRQPVKISEIHIGDGIGAMGEMDQSAKTVHALFVSVVDADQIRKIREAMGKTWISGRVTAIADLKLTILRSDKVVQVIAVDEDTSFKRGGRGMRALMQGDGAIAPPLAGAGGSESGGQSITLEDLKVGDQVAGQGSIKSGVFVPVTLVVADPAARHRREGAERAPAAQTQPGAASGPAPEPK